MDTGSSMVAITLLILLSIVYLWSGLTIREIIKNSVKNQRHTLQKYVYMSLIFLGTYTLLWLSSLWLLLVNDQWGWQNFTAYVINKVGLIFLETILFVVWA